MKRLGLMTGALALTVLTTIGCSSGGGTADEGSSTTFSISGTLGGLTLMSTQQTKLGVLGYLKNQFITATAVSMMGTGEGQESTFSNQCADGAFYRVLCSAWSTPPVAAYGDVSCGGGASGSFTVSGLPLNTDVSCAVRKSTDGSDFVPFANLELPADSLSGGTDTINAEGNMRLAVTVDSSTGSLTTTIVSGDNKADDNIGSVTVDASSMTGFFNMTCPTNISTANTVKCKCFLFDDNDTDACIASNASGISDSEKFSINLNVYEGTIQAGGLDMDGDTVADISEGSKIYAGTVWRADSDGNGTACTNAAGCSSYKSGTAEGLPTFSGAIDWTTANVDDAITFDASGDLTCGAGTVNVNIPAYPGPTGTRTEWRDWLAALTDAYDDAAKCSTTWNGCDSGIATGSRHTDKFCVANFAWAVLGNSEVDAPRVHIDWSQMCDSTGCGNNADPVPVNAINVEGIEFNNDGTVAMYMPGPKNRYVMDQFIPNSTGTGGSLKSHSEYTRTWKCDEIAGGASDCHVDTDANAWLECSIGEDLRINFIPSGTAGVFNMVFDSSLYVRKGEINGANMDMGYDRDGWQECKALLDLGTSVPSFLARATKL